MKKFLLLIGLLCNVVYAQTSYKIITPFAPGFNNLVVLRAIPELNKATGFEFHQEVAGGAGGVIATNTFLNGKDPNRLLVGTQNALNILPAVASDIKYTRSDFKPVALIGENYMCLVVSDALKVDTYSGFLKIAKTTPLFYGTNLGVNGMEHLWFEYVKSRNDLNITAIHYKGAMEAQTAVMKGEVAMALLPVAMCKADLPGRVVVGYTTQYESKSLPADAHVSAYMAIMAPKDMPDQQVKILSEAFAQVWTDNKSTLTDIVRAPRSILTGKELHDYIEDQDKKWLRYVKAMAPRN